jgi:hypothetical protein
LQWYGLTVPPSTSQSVPNEISLLVRTFFDKKLGLRCYGFMGHLQAGQFTNMKCHFL